MALLEIRDIDVFYGDVQVVEGTDVAVAIDLTGDNLGPRSAEDLIAAFAEPFQQGIAAQRQHTRAILLREQSGFVNLADLLPTMQYPENRRRHEDGEEFHEVLPAKRLLSLCTKP